MADRPLNPEDYIEPECVICGKPGNVKQPSEHIPQQRVSQRVDELMGKKDYEGTERTLKYWLAEAEACGDEQGRFFLYNEMMGFYRKTGKKEEGYKVIEEAVSMLEELGYENSISGATCYTNAATVYTTFNEAEKGINMFLKAKDIYEANAEGNEFYLAGLYNNMATALSSLGNYDDATVYFFKAIETLTGVENSELELGQTYLNLLDVHISQHPYVDKDDALVRYYLDTARSYLDKETLERDSYYSYVCDKCVDIYDYFDDKEYADELRERIREIDERA